MDQKFRGKDPSVLQLYRALSLVAKSQVCYGVLGCISNWRKFANCISFPLHTAPFLSAFSAQIRGKVGSLPLTYLDAHQNLGVCIEVLLGFSYVCSPDHFIITLLSQGCVLETASGNEQGEWNALSKDKGGCDEPPGVECSLWARLGTFLAL